MEHEHSQVRHLTTEQLLDYLESRLSPADRELVETHLASGCQACQADLSWLQKTTELMRSYDWLEPPARLHDSATRLIQKKRRRSRSTLSDWLGSFAIQPRTFAAAVAVIVIVLITSSVLLWSNQASAPKAELAGVQGSVALQQNGREEWIRVHAEDEIDVQEGSAVRTGGDSKVLLSFPDNSKVLVDADTELSILRMNALADGSARVIVLRQETGSTHNLVQTNTLADSRYEIQTPSATVLVHGTEFTVTVDKEKSTHVAVNDGEVLVLAQGVEVALVPGESITVNAGKAPSTVKAVPILPSPPELTNGRQPVTEPVESVTEVATNPVQASSTPTPTKTRTPTPTPTRTPVATWTPSPTAGATTAPAPTTAGSQPPTATNTPSGPQPLPTETEMPSPTPVPTETSKKMTPPGQTNTPEPPGRTRNPSSTTSNNNSSLK